MKSKKICIFALVLSLLCHLSPSSSYAADMPPTVPTQSLQENFIIPGGRCVGVTLSTKGVLVTDISDVAGEKNIRLSPAKDAGLRPGDLIQSFDNKKTPTVTDLNEAIKTSSGKESKLEFLRDGNHHQVLIKPAISQTDNSLKIGAWVKDAASGIGTITYYNPHTNQFAALGHGICDSDTGDILNISNGNVYPASVVSITKGEKGIPGELNGIFEENGDILGQITNNSLSGIFGKLEDNTFDRSNLTPIAKRNEVSVGKAKILSNIHGQAVEEFDIEISKIMSGKLSPHKSIIIKITDPKLLNKTGGIVRGMSGSPILQNGKIVGAVTHVFVNDPTRGYGIFIEDMLDNAQSS